MKSTKTEIAVAVIVAAMLAAGCKTTVPTKDSVVTVKTAEVEMFGGEDSILLPAKVRTAQDIDVAFKVSGTLATTPVKVGQAVSKGETIAVMDDRDYAIQFSATEAEYNQIKGEVERVINLYKTNSVSRSDYDKAVAGLQQITAKYNAHRNALEDTRLKAPVDGRVVEIIHSEGETVGAGYPVVRLAGGTIPEVEVSLPASAFLMRDNFTSITAKINLFPNRTFPLEILSINQSANLNGLYPARLSFANSKSAAQVTAGMVATVTFGYKNAPKGRLSIPSSALVCRDGKSAVWLYDAASGTVSTVEVETADILSNGRVIILHGLSEGEQVVSAGTRSLREGMKVKPIAPKSATNKGGLL